VLFNDQERLSGSCAGWQQKSSGISHEIIAKTGCTKRKVDFSKEVHMFSLSAVCLHVHNCHEIHNNVFKNTKLLHVSGLTGPSSGRTLIVVV
jgi:hypothetical protein